LRCSLIIEVCLVSARRLVVCRDSCTMYRSGLRSGSASWCSTVCTTKHPSTLLTSASLSPVSPPDNIFALPAEVFSSCLAIVSAVRYALSQLAKSQVFRRCLKDSQSCCARRSSGKEFHADHGALHGECSPANSG